MHAHLIPLSKEEISIRDYLDWVASVPPAEREQEKDDWRLMEARRLEALRQLELTLEVHPC